MRNHSAKGWFFIVYPAISKLDLESAIYARMYARALRMRYFAVRERTRSPKRARKGSSLPAGLGLTLNGTREKDPGGSDPGSWTTPSSGSQGTPYRRLGR